MDYGIVEPVDTSKPTLWTSALHLQAKKCGGLRPCGDFRPLNSQIQLDRYPLPHLQKWTHKLHGAKHFTELDIKKAYHHLEVAKKDRHKTAVLTPWGCWYVLLYLLAIGDSTKLGQLPGSSTLSAWLAFCRHRPRSDILVGREAQPLF